MTATIIQFVPRPKPTESNVIEMGPMIDLSKLEEFRADHDWPDEQPDEDEEPC